MQTSKINQLVLKHDTKLLGITDKLVKDLEQYQRNYENLLLKQNFAEQNGKLLSNAENYNKAQTFDPFKLLGFAQLAIKHIRPYQNVAEDQIAFSRKLGYEFDARFLDVSIVKAFQDADLQNLLGEGQRLDNIVQNRLVNNIALGTSYKETVQGISEDLLGTGEKLGTLARFADTYMRTSMFAMTRQIDKRVYDSVGEDMFMYSGPLDKRTRPFCKAHLGKIYTMAEINDFGQSGIPSFIAPGGWNCRHMLVGTSILDMPASGDIGTHRQAMDEYNVGQSTATKDAVQKYSRTPSRMTDAENTLIKKYVTMAPKFDGTVYRHVSTAKHFESMSKGDIKFRDVVSTTLSMDTAKKRLSTDAIGDVIYKIRTRQAADITALSALAKTEEELLLNTRSRFKIVSENPKDGFVEIILQEL